MLLAQADPTTILTYLIEKGPATALFGLVMYLIWMYGGTWFKGQIELVEVLKDCSKRNTEGLEKSNQNLEVLTKSFTAHAKVPKMLGHIAEAAKAATDDMEVHRHLDRVLDERDR
jgi:hypothetical protein